MFMNVINVELNVIEYAVLTKLAKAKATDFYTLMKSVVFKV